MIGNIPSITTTLQIGGHDFSTDELTSLLGIQPTKIWRQQREWIKTANPELATIGWEYKLEKQRRWSIGEAIDDLLNVFWNHRGDITDFVARNHLRLVIRCVPFGDASLIEYVINAEVLNKLAFLGATLSLGVYVDTIIGAQHSEAEKIPESVK